MTSFILHLLHLASPTLPVGSYTYSQGLEWAVELGTVKDRDSAYDWIKDYLLYGLARFDGVYLAHMYTAWENKDEVLVMSYNESFIASRESMELRAETLQMGFSLKQLLIQQNILPNNSWNDISEVAYPLVWSFAAHYWRIPKEQAVVGFLWSWVENQVMSAVKIVPLGQRAGQSLLIALIQEVLKATDISMTLSLDQVANALPGLAIASSRHESQYTRLFRS